MKLLGRGITFYSQNSCGWSDETIYITGENGRRGRSSTVLHIGEERKFLKKVISWYLSTVLKCICTQTHIQKTKPK